MIRREPKTLLQIMGFRDPDLGDPLHAEIIHWIDTEVIIMKTPWIIAIRPTPAVLEKHGKPANTIEVYEPWRWFTSALLGDGPEYLIMEMDDGPSIRWSFDLIDQLTITRRTEGGQ